MDAIGYSKVSRTSRRREMRALIVLSVLFVLSFLPVATSANVFDLGSGLTNLEMVTVGDPGNAPDTRYATPGYGSVGYVYNIGKYEVTAVQYCDFLNHKAVISDDFGLYNDSMWSSTQGCQIQRGGSGMPADPYTYSVAADLANRPVDFVSFWDSCRFANWLHNGQADGDTETGAYVLNGYTGRDGREIQRNPGAKWFVPSENEWYKAAYYKSGGTSAGYWDYPTQSDVAPSNEVIDPDPGNNANYNHPTYGYATPYHRTIVGEFENSDSAYGTFDQGGNVWEWNEAIKNTGELYAWRDLRGGAWPDTSPLIMTPTGDWYFDPNYEGHHAGFRVAAAIPEPSSLIALGSGILALAGLIRRRR
jgi:sulfatase modifying factor 1